MFAELKILFGEKLKPSWRATGHSSFSTVGSNAKSKNAWICYSRIAMRAMYTKCGASEWACTINDRERDGKYAKIVVYRSVHAPSVMASEVYLPPFILFAECAREFNTRKRYLNHLAFRILAHAAIGSLPQFSEHSRRRSPLGWWKPEIIHSTAMWTVGSLLHFQCVRPDWMSFRTRVHECQPKTIKPSQVATYTLARIDAFVQCVVDENTAHQHSLAVSVSFLFCWRLFAMTTRKSLLYHSTATNFLDTFAIYYRLNSIQR